MQKVAIERDSMFERQLRTERAKGGRGKNEKKMPCQRRESDLAVLLQLVHTSKINKVHHM
jgi:hypothetical protein